MSSVLVKASTIYRLRAQDIHKSLGVLLVHDDDASGNTCPVCFHGPPPTPILGGRLAVLATAGAPSSIGAERAFWYPAKAGSIIERKTERPATILPPNPNDHLRT